jgi:hypothetical protein
LPALIDLYRNFQISDFKTEIWKVCIIKIRAKTVAY